MINKNNTKLLRALPLLVLGMLIIITGIVILISDVVYSNGHEITHDKTANINVMLTRPEGWHKIETGKISLDEEFFRHIDGSTATIPITAELARQFLDADDERLQNSVFTHHTTHHAYEYLIESKTKDNYYHVVTDIIFVTEPSESELSEAEKRGVKFDITPVAMDGFVFITHKDNPVDSLTVQQIQDIYTGRITNWKDVGGLDAPIIPYQREANSGSQTAMEQTVMQGEEMIEPDGYELVYGMGRLVEKVAEYENSMNSLGYTYYYYINNLYRNDNIKVLKVNGISPDNENLISRAYPFTAAYCAVMREGQSGTARELRDYLLTDEGQKIIKLAGYCPVRQEK